MAYGRGGAGNFYKAQEENKKVAEDVEAQSVPSVTPSAATATAPQPYAHTGRGGAGNWYTPSSLAQTGTFIQPTDATTQPTGEKLNISKPWVPEGQELPVGRSGRGGAGNFVWKSNEKKDEVVKEKEEEEEEEEEEEVRLRVERDVEAGLQKPGAVKVGRNKEDEGKGLEWVYN